MPSRESVSEAIRARTEFTTAVRKGIDALMGRCGYSRERATLTLLKELNRGNGPDSKPTDKEIFDTMRRHKLGLDEASRTFVVSRAMRRELLSREDKSSNTIVVTPTEAIQRLTSILSLENILYESGEDESDEDGQNERLPLKIPKLSGVPSSSSSINLSPSSSSTTSTNTTTHSNSSSRKNARSKKNSSPTPRKQLKVNHIRNKVNNNNNNSSNISINTSNTILVGRKRSIEDMDPTKENSEVGTKAATGRTQLRASKRLHRSSASTEPSVSSTNK